MEKIRFEIEATKSENDRRLIAGCIHYRNLSKTVWSLQIKLYVKQKDDIFVIFYLVFLKYLQLTWITYVNF